MLLVVYSEKTQQSVQELLNHYMMILLQIFGENFPVLIILVLCLSLLSNDKQRPRGSRPHASILSFYIL